MSIALLLAIYFIVWWIVLFAVLPIGVVTQAEVGEVVPGTPESAPAQFRLLRVVIITTVAATVILFALWASVHWGLIDLQATLMDAG
jgi:predicted secreted protein